MSDTQKRIAEIRELVSRYPQDGSGAFISGVLFHFPWLLEQLAERDAEIERLDLEIKKAWAKTEWLKTQTKCAWCAGENSACTWCNP